MTLADAGPSRPGQGRWWQILAACRLAVSLFQAATSQLHPAGMVMGRRSTRFLLPAQTDADAYAYSKTLKIYPLSEAANPSATRFVDPQLERVR